MRWRRTRAIAPLCAAVCAAAAAALPAQSQDQVDPGRIDELIAVLESGKSVKRYRAAIELQKMGARGSRAIPALVGVLDHPIKDISYRAASALGKMGPLALPSLREALRHENPRVRANAARGIAGIGSAAAPAVPDLVRALSDDDRRVRSQAANALARIGPAARGAVPDLLDALRLEDEDATGWGYYRFSNALARLASEDELVAALRDPHAQVRLDAAIAVGTARRPLPKAVQALIVAAEDPHPYVRDAALSALGSTGPVSEESVPVLIENLGGDSWSAEYSLGEVGRGLRSRGVTLWWVVPRVYWWQLLLSGIALVVWFGAASRILRNPKVRDRRWAVRFGVVLAPPLAASLMLFGALTSAHWADGFIPQPPLGVLQFETMGNLSIVFCCVLATVWALTRHEIAEDAARDANPGGDGGAPAP